ncbi:sialate O-acetylesterase [Olivibacter domesticus]|uniref:Sialate O-acetylesterase n=2 Tax=Olivibacter domesticus TaxID=407022 RepID=A0A1H7YPV5_OLID1|nr:sialate O-acetylesterase [Olivibacter domesticus]
MGAIFTDNIVLQQRTKAPIWGWAAPNTKIEIISSWDQKKYSSVTDKKGRWVIKVQTPAAGGPYELKISDGAPLVLKNVLIGEVWLCSGQSNMEMPLKGFKGQPVWKSNETILHSKNGQLRLYTVPRSSQLERQEDSKTSFWKEANPENVANFSATAYYFGKLLQELLEVPIGLIHSSYGGSTIEAWMDRELLADFKDIKLPKDSIPVKNRTPTTLYNGMIHPIIGYAIKGCIWYQGESNYERPDQYELLFPAMVKRWRELWQQGDFPFYYMQIAPYNYAQLPPFYAGGKYNSAYLRDAQRKSLSKIPNSEMASLMDVGEENCIHPANKKVGGERLACIALAQTYHLKGFGWACPTYEAIEITEGSALVKFKNASLGLTSFGNTLKNFEIAGADKIFHPAQAAIRGNAVILTSPFVTTPIAVRYAFKDFVVGDLFSTEGLPVASFRTDDW